jgi:hypothetical protein
MIDIARPYIKESITTFTSGLDYKTHNGTLGPTKTTGPFYVGNRTAEIDEAWEKIVDSMFYLGHAYRLFE